MICKNCGYENAEGSAFCAECGAPLVQEESGIPNAIPAEPAEQTFAAPAAPEVPQTFAAPAAPEVPQTFAAPAQQNFEPQPGMPAYGAPSAPVYAAPKPVKEKGKGGKIALIVTVAVLALALIAAGVFCYLLYAEKMEREEEDGALRVQLEEIEGKYETLSGDYDTLSGDYDALSGSYDDLSGDYAALSDKYETLSGDYTELSGKYDELDAAYNELYDYSNGLYEDYSGMYDEYRFFKAYAVICSDMNKYYHTHACTEWDHSSFWIYNVDAAIGKGYTACPACHPEG